MAEYGGGRSSLVGGAVGGGLDVSIWNPPFEWVFVEGDEWLRLRRM